MEKSGLLQIGELAKICEVSVQTLRYYDKIHLLKPAYIDPETNYRYYTRDHIFIIKNTRILKDAGFSLIEIKEFLEKKSIHDITSLYTQKARELDCQINELIQTRDKILYCVDYLGMMLAKRKKVAQKMLGRIMLKEVPAQQVVYIRDKVVYNYPAMMFHYNHLLNIIFNHKLHVAEDLITIFHSPYNDLYHKKIDVELCMVLQDQGRIDDFSRNLAGGLYASCIHRGKYPSSISTYEKMQAWISEQGYITCGPVMHILMVPIAAAEVPDETVFEIRIPVKKA